MIPEYGPLLKSRIGGVRMMLLFIFLYFPYFSIFYISYIYIHSCGMQVEKEKVQNDSLFLKFANAAYLVLIKESAPAHLLA